MVEQRFLPYPESRAGTREALEAVIAKPAHLIKAECHHDLPLELAKWFAMHGLDVNEVQHLRWVEGVKSPANRKYHHAWSEEFSREWRVFRALENPDHPYTQARIIEFRDAIRGRYPEGGIPR